MKHNINYFGIKLDNPRDIFLDPQLKEILKESFHNLFRAYGLSKNQSDQKYGELYEAAISRTSQFDQIARRIFNVSINSELKRNSLEKRAVKIFNQIDEFLVGTSILDYGCGDGLISFFIEKNSTKNFDIYLTDIKCYLDPRVVLPFKKIENNNFDNISNKFDTTLLLTVLHHSQDPVQLLDYVKKITSKRVIIIESVYDIDDNSSTYYSPLNGLSKELQLKYAIFWDWFYNRIIHHDVSVPYNFTSPKKWKTIFLENNYSILYEENLGIDQPIVPEHHYLFVLEI